MEKTDGVSCGGGGATGNVGREMLNILADRDFPIERIAAVASNNSKGKTVEFGDEILTISSIDTFDFTGWDIALFAIGSQATAKYAPLAADAGCVVIDNSSLFRYDPEVPLIVPEVNPKAISGFTNKNVIANPNCSTAQMLVALKPLHEVSGIRRIVVSTYQSVSGSGKAAMDELWRQTRGIFVPGQEVEPKAFTKQIAFNCIPHIDQFMDSGDTREEWKMRAETHKILDPNIAVSATCVRVPVFVGHAESINLSFEFPITVAEAREALSEAPGVLLMDAPEKNEYATPIDCVGEYDTFVSRVRTDPTIENGLNLWCVSDNLRKGAALNTVQIAELLCTDPTFQQNYRALRGGPSGAHTH